jgi:cell wall-associated NlpC family hydrolase
VAIDQTPKSPLFRSATVTGTPLPSAQLATYANQQIGGLNAGLGAGVLSGQAAAAGSSEAKDRGTPVALSAQRTVDSVNESNQRLTALAKQTAARRVANRDNSGSGFNQGGGSTSLGNIGEAYSSSGNLSKARNNVLSKASSYLGSRYQLGGTTTRGIDCSGLVKMAYGQVGMDLAHYVPTQVKQIGGVRTSLNKLRPGDIVAWEDGSHIAIYAGNGQIIESAGGYGARRTKLYYNAGRMYGIALRLPGE